MKKNQKKYQTITSDLLNKIRSGELKPGDRIPAERPLADQYKVARLTARRALCDLEERGLVIRDGRRGTTIAEHVGNTSAQTLTLLCSATPASALLEEIIRFTLAKAKKNQWIARVIRVMENDEKPMLDAIKVGNPTIIYGSPQDLSPSGKLEKAIRKAGSHVAIISGRIESDNTIPSVMCDDDEGMEIAIQTLKDAGHSHIAMVAPSGDPNHAVVSVLVQKWKDKMQPTMTEEELSENLIFLKTAYPENTLITMHKKLKNHLASPVSKKITAMICLTEEEATAAVAACRETGRPVPEKMSLMEYGWTPRSELTNPPRSGINSHVDRHIDIAFDLLMQLRKGETPEKLHHLIKPELIERKTVAPPAQ